MLQILAQMTSVHRTTFIFLVKFMKDLLKCSEQNGLDPKVLGETSNEGGREEGDGGREGEGRKEGYV